MAETPDAQPVIAATPPPPPPAAPVPLTVPTSPLAPWDPQGAGAAAAERLPAKTTPGYAPVTNLAIPAEGRALLGVIGSPGFESSGGYTQRFNQPDFADFSRHPGTYGKIASGPNRGKVSNAAGRYQFLSTTYADQAKKLGLKDFSPASQDAAAWNLAREAYARQYRGRDLATDLKDPHRLPQVAGALRSQWTSLPGGIEARSKFKSFSQGYAGALKAEVARAGGGAQFARPAPVTIPPPPPGVRAAQLNAMYPSQGG